MLERAKEVIQDVSKETDSVILFHSMSGKDSIALLDLLYGNFKRIVCCYMYVVPNLAHINRYFVYAQENYPGTEFIQVPHYGYFSMIKTGFMGCQKNEKQRLWTLADITEKVKERTGIEWSCFGFKQSDSFNRLLMLRQYEKLAINRSTKKFYPLSTYNNKDVLRYIAENNLKSPENYGNTSAQSCGADITAPEYLLFLRDNYPQDLEKIYKVFPMAKLVLMKYEKGQ